MTTELDRCHCVSIGRGHQSHGLPGAALWALGSCPEALSLEDDANRMALALQCLHEDINSSRWGHVRECMTCLRAWQIIDDQQLVIVIVSNKGKCSCSWDVSKMLTHEGHRSSGRVAVIELSSVEDRLQNS